MNGQKKDALAEVGGGSQGVTQKLGQPSGRDDVAFCFQDTTIPTAVQLLDDLGFDVIPLRPLKKLPLRLKWQSLPAAEQWQGAPAGCNVGLRHGGAMRLASVEAERDRPDAIPALRRFLAGLGYDWGAYPANLTAHRGERYFFALDDAPDGHSRKMGDDLGKGELRFGPGAYALIPPSTLADGGRYEMLGGAWDGELPKLTWLDVAPLLANGSRLDLPEVTPAELSATAQALADANLLPADVRERLRGQGGKNYPSTDDYTTVLRLATLGYDADSTMALLLAHPGFGYFSDLAEKDSAAAVKWLYDAHAHASAYAAKNGSDIGKHLARLIAQAERKPWPGRAGPTTKAIYIAHLEIALDASAPVWAGASRRLADMVNVSNVTATNATHRLIDAGMLELHTEATAQYAAEYALPADDNAQDLPLKFGGTNLSGKSCANITAEGSESSSVGVCVRGDSGVKLAEVQAVLAHDLFSWAGFGKSGALVYAALLDEPGTVEDLAKRTGRHATTVKRALSKLAAIPDGATGELYALVEDDGAGTWEIARSSDYGANLDHAARLLGVDGTGEQRRQKHERERQRRDASLTPYKNGEIVPGRTSTRGKWMTKRELTNGTRSKTARERQQE